MKEETDRQLADAFVEAARNAVAQEFQRIKHSLGQLNDAEIWQRPEPHVNCIGNILLHLCGNLGQWFLHGIGGAADVRNRPAEFSETEHISRDELFATFSRIIGEVDALLKDIPPKVLLEFRRIQGSDTTGIEAIFGTVSHLEGHALQIVYITHMFLGDRYEPFWEPASPEQGG